MPKVDVAVLADHRRLAAARRARQVLPHRPMPLNAIARLAARSLGAPMAIVAIMDVDEEHFVGSYGLPAPLDTQEPVPAAYSLCKYIVSADHPVIVDDMSAEPNLVDHALAVEHGARAFAGVPLRDAADHTIGSLLVVDTEPHHFTDADVTTLVEISALLAGPGADADHSDPAAADPPGRTGPSAVEPEAAVPLGFLHALLDSLDAGVLSVDAAGQPVLVNRAMRRLHGIAEAWTPEQLFGIFADRVRRSDGAILPIEMSPLSRALRGETIRDHEILIRVPGDRAHLFSGNAQPVIGSHGQRLGAVLALHEVTEQRRAERFRDCHLAVAAALTRTGSLEEAAGEVVRAVATASGWPYAELRLVDDITGTLRPAGHHSALPGGSAAHARRPIIKGQGIVGSAWASGEPLPVPDLRETSRLARTALPDVNICLRAGLRTMIAWPIVDGDHVVGVLTCGAGTPERDQSLLVTPLGGVADQLGQFPARLRAEQLSVEVERCRRDFLTLVGHEMRTPLTSISSFVNMLMEETAPADDHRQLLRSIARNTATLCDIVDKLLDLAGLELGHQALTERPIDLAEIARQALNDAQPDAGRNHVTLTARIPAGLMTAGDPFRLRQALNHLLSNAVKYSRQGDLVRLSLDHDDDLVTIIVTDTGLGIPPDENDHLFERFYRATNVRHQGIPGTGLGLPLVRAIVEAHHGTVVLSHPASSGTTVTVRLPATRQ